MCVKIAYKSHTFDLCVPVQCYRAKLLRYLKYMVEEGDCRAMILFLVQTQKFLNSFLRTSL